MTATAPQLQQLLTLKLHPHRNCKIATATAPQPQKIWNSHLAPHYNCSCVILSANNPHFPFNISIFTNFHTPYQKRHWLFWSSLETETVHTIQLSLKVMIWTVNLNSLLHEIYCQMINPFYGSSNINGILWFINGVYTRCNIKDH